MQLQASSSGAAPLRRGQRAAAAARPRRAPVVVVRAQQQQQQQTTTSTTTTAFPDFMPAEVAEITEPAARALLARVRRTPVPIASLPTIGALATAFVGPTDEQRAALRGTSSSDTSSSSGSGSGSGAAAAALPPVVLLHGFDSSCLEFRRLVPLLEPHAETYAVDLVGWGFTDCAPFAQNPDLTVSPRAKREHLRAFWEAHVGRPMCLVGGSLGGAAAMDFALHYPEAVDRLVLIDGQGWIDGIGPMASLPRPLAAAGVWVLRTEALRMAANKMAYHDVERCATPDAMRCGRLHTHLPGWADANVAFMRSGGYSLSARIPEVLQPTLVLWGRQDAILDPKYALQFEQALPNGRLEWVEACGHCAHLEQPAAAAEKILAFLREGRQEGGAERGAAADPSLN